MYDGIIFDIDGTLWDSRRGVAESWNTALREKTDYDITLDYEELGKLFGKPMNEIFAAIFPDMSEEETTELIPVFYDYEHRYLASHPPALYEGTMDTLRALAARYPLYIVTNAQCGYIECLFEAAGIGKYFTDWLCYGDTGAQKDVTMRMLIEKNGLKNPVYIGDTQGDYDACKRANVPMIYASYGLGEVREPDITIDAIGDLIDILLK